MALLHAAELRPSKLELLAGWLPTQGWYDGDADGLEQLGAYRFDDPDGGVGIETFLLADGDRVLHVPVTYRGAPLEGGEEWLIGTMEHTVLGSRWVYDALGDPVYREVLTRTILTGGTEAALEREADGVRTPVEPSARVQGSGLQASPIVPVEVEVRHKLDEAPHDGDLVLTGSWAGVTEPIVLAVARRV
ncbi:MAG: hypothetical protein JWR27_2142 [Aeromicrobium sp.]|jgi:hypothetical protein|nr:hypothetical protein [Aeromicrobium sp.]